MKYTTKFLSLLSFLLLMGTTTAIQAQDQKLAYLDPETILTNMPEYKAAQSDVQAYTKVLETQLKQEEEALQKYAADIMQKAQSGLLTPMQQQEAEKEITQRQQNLQRKAQEADQKLAKKQQTAIEPVFTKLNDAIKAVAEAGNYTYVFDKKMFLHSGGEDITAKVKAQLGI